MPASVQLAASVGITPSPAFPLFFLLFRVAATESLDGGPPAPSDSVRIFFVVFETFGEGDCEEARQAQLFANANQ
jgi:hypothetical protein